MSNEFKSSRAAKIAMTKAEKAYLAARNVENCAYEKALSEGHPNPWQFKEIARAECVRLAAIAQDVHDRAEAQGFYVSSFHFGYNPTRELIRANID